MGDWTGQPGTALGPLTKTWTPPASCSIAWVSCTTCVPAWRAQTCQETGNLADAGDCWPPRTRSLTHQAPFLGWGYYSPGYVCPAGYTTACDATAGGPSGWQVQFALRPEETAIGCCPSGYKCANNMGNTCVQVQTATTVPVAMCESGGVTRDSVITLPFAAAADASGSTTTDTVSEYNVMAPMYQLIFRPNDLPSSTSSPTTGVTRGTSGASSAATQAEETTEMRTTPGLASSTGAPGSAEDSSDGSLSTGARVGLGLGVGLGIIVVVALVMAAYFIRRKRQSKQAPPPAYHDHGASNGRYVYSAHSTNRGTPSELAVIATPAEMPAYVGEVAEMDGTVMAEKPIRLRQGAMWK